MRVLGLATKVSGTAITVSAVVLEGVISGGPLDLTSVVVSSSFEFKEDFGEDLASLLGTLAKKVSGRIRSIDPDVVVVRRADWNRNTGGQRGPRLRLLAEGDHRGCSRSSAGDEDSHREGMRHGLRRVEGADRRRRLTGPWRQVFRGYSGCTLRIGRGRLVVEAGDVVNA